MFTRLSSGIVGAILILHGFIGLQAGRLDSLVYAVGAVSDWRAIVEAVAIIALGIAIVFRLSIVKIVSSK